jgi:hypothetical protein
MALQFDVKRGSVETIKKIKYRKWYVTINGESDKSFAFAFEVRDDTRPKKRGLKFDPEIINYGVEFDPKDYRTEYGHWADFIYPTAQCETGGYFNSVNTYDIAFFSFGFMQMTVRDANKQFIPTLRALLETPKAADYFPDLVLREVKGKKYIHQKVAEDQYVQLETRTNASKLQHYLTPSQDVVEKLGAERAFRMMHWATNEKTHRDIQVRAVIENLKERLRNAWSNWYPLDGKPDTVCLVVCDIHHQGRAKRSKIKKVFDGAGGDDKKLYAELLKLGRKRDQHRRERLDEEIQDLVVAGVLGKKKYSKANNDFV